MTVAGVWPTFDLAWPEAALHQNTRGHWAKSSFRRKKARVVGKRECAAAIRKIKLRMAGDERIKLVIRFHEPALNRKRDLQNLMGAMKYGVDGIADALGIDDSEFAFDFDWGHGVETVDGFVRVTITTVKGEG